MQTQPPNHITGKAEAIERIGDAGIYREIAFVFKENLPNYTGQIENAMEERDYETIRRLAHSIKSNCATIGADELRIFFGSMEEAAEQGLEAELLALTPQALAFLSELRQNIANM